jgi:DNA-binding NarL/FixJ family response regulator
VKSVFTQIAKQLSAGNVELSDRELTTARAYNMGETYQDIAYSMGLSPRTIESYVNRVVKKTGAKNMRHACYILRTRMVI